MSFSSKKDKEVALFVGIVVAIITIFLVVIYFKLQIIFALILIAALVIVLVLLSYGKFWFQLMDYERAVVFRKGIFNRVVGPGWIFIIPGLETYEVVDLRVKEVDVPPQIVHSRDGMAFKIDAVVFLRVSDPKKAILNVDNYTRAVIDFIVSRLRDVIGKLPWEQVIGNIKEINVHLKNETKELTKDWGIEVVKVEIQNIKIPEEVEQAIKEKEAAERKKLARKELAEGEALRLHAINQVTKDMSPQALQYLYLQALQALADGKANKIILPVELSKLAESLSDRFGGNKDDIFKELVKLAKEENLLKEE
jgi:regulator of protease activity HflC (stomatin/prohibitin superfamily)